MARFNTGNPLGSNDPRDLSDNSDIIDNYVNSQNASERDRFGVARRTWAGIEDEANLNISAAEQAKELAEEARDQAVAAAEASGSNVKFAQTYADATALLPLADGTVVEVFEDENNDGSRTRYIVESGALVFAVDLDQTRRDLANGLDPSKGANLVRSAYPATGAVPYEIPKVLNATFYPWMFGAVGDGVTNDQDAFVKMSAALQAAGGGKVVIDRPYVVFKQSANPAPAANQPYWQTHGHAINADNCNGVIIEFISGGELITAPGLRFGSFDPLTGERYDPPPGNFTNSAYRAAIGRAISLQNTTNFAVVNPKLRGSMDDIIIGGRWGDLGIQVDHTGIRCQNARSGVVINPDVHDFGLDGIYITQTAGTRVDVVIIGGESIRNGRQGLSWTGGGGVRVYGTRFAETGKGPIASAPRAGIDIEHNGQGIFDGEFSGVTTSDNVGSDLLVLNGTRDIKWIGGYIGGGGTGRALYLDGVTSGIDFYSTTISGSVVNLESLRFFSCTFTDKVLPGRTPYTGLVLDVYSPAYFNNCEFEFYEKGTYKFNIRGGAQIIGGRIRFLQTDPNKRWRAGILGDCRLEDVVIEGAYTFVEEDPSTYVSGEYTYVDIGSSTRFRGSSRIKGDQLATVSRTGNVNYHLGFNRENWLSSDEVINLTGDGPYTHTLPYGEYILQVSATTAFPADARRTIAATFVCYSSVGSNAANHAADRIGGRLSALGAAGDITVTRVGSRLVLTITPDAGITLDGGGFSLRYRNLDLGRVPSE